MLVKSSTRYSYYQLILFCPFPKYNINQRDKRTKRALHNIAAICKRQLMLSCTTPIWSSCWQKFRSGHL